MIKTVLNIRQELVYQHPELGKSYRRVVGALAWPMPPEPGYLLVMAENWVRDTDLQAQPMRILAERSLDTIYSLHQGCLELRKLCCVNKWLTDMGRNQETRIFLHQNKVRHLQREVLLAPAPYAKEGPKLRIYLQLIDELIQEGRKILTFGEESQVRLSLMSLAPEDMKRPAAELPPLAALGYAAAEMILREPPDMRTLKQKPVTTWDPRQWMGGR